MRLQLTILFRSDWVMTSDVRIKELWFWLDELASAWSDDVDCVVVLRNGENVSFMFELMMELSMSETQFLFKIY
jgi:hypothetical protein